MQTQTTPLDSVAVDMMAGELPPPGQSLTRRAIARFAKNRAAVAGVVVVVLMTLLSIFVPMLNSSGIERVNWDALLQAPSAAHPFGTDINGRDLMSRVFYGGRISLAIGVLATSVSVVIGVIYGAIAGFVGGKVEAVMMRICDIIYALPTLFFIIILVTVLGAKNILIIFCCIGCVEWLTIARIVRGQTLSVKKKEYVEAARAIGLSTPAILTRYIIPNVTSPVVVYVTLLIPVNILIESYLSFLGLGVQEPLTSWGQLISQGSNEIEDAPWLLIFPSIMLTATLFAFNFIGDGLRDALDPRDR